MALTKVQPEMMGQLTASIMPAGSVIQTVQGSITTPFGSTSTTYVAIGLSASITPTSSTSKIMVFVNVGSLYLGDNNQSVFTTIYRGAINLGTGSSSALAQAYPYTSTGANNIDVPVAIGYLDSPATTSSTTYTVYMKATGGTNGFSAQNNGIQSTITLMEIHG